MWVGEKKPGIGYEPRPGQKKEHFSQFPPASGEAQPAWIAYDKRVLSFNGFFEEVVINNNSEAFRIRPVKVYFYLEDDTIQVNEPLIENSGLSQGTVRHISLTCDNAQAPFSAYRSALSVLSSGRN